MALRRLRVSWKRTKQWITGPDPAQYYNVTPMFKGGYTLEVNFGEKYQRQIVARYSAAHVEHQGRNMSVFIGTFLSTPLLHIEKTLLSAKFEWLDNLKSRLQADLDNICETFNVGCCPSKP